MKAILGLGNPGLRYINTRHNIGFNILEQFALKHNLEFDSSSVTFDSAEGILEGSRFLLVKPTTFVNLSGIAARQVFEQYDVSLADFLVLTDDVNLSLGKIRIRNSGGDGGHNGLHSIIEHLGIENFPRIRFGIGDYFESGNIAIDDQIQAICVQHVDHLFSIDQRI